MSAADGERIVRLIAHHIGAEVHAETPRVSAKLPETRRVSRGFFRPSLRSRSPDKLAIEMVKTPRFRGYNRAGFGPASSLRCNILGSLDVKTILVERNEFTSDLPRALVVDDEYMRVLDKLGILPVMRDDIAAPFGIFFYSSRGRRSSELIRS